MDGCCCSIRMRPLGQRFKELLTGLEYPFGLVIGPDKKLYASTAEAIFRFDPLADNPRGTVETVIRHMPGRRITLPDGTRLDESAHPLKQFVFDRDGRLFVNVGSHSDDCITRAPITKPCAAAEGASAMAAIWLFTPPSGGVFPALKPNDPDPPHSRLCARSAQFDGAGTASELPGCRLRLPARREWPRPADIFKPNEEINAIEQGRHYGWPYCYDLSTPSPNSGSCCNPGAYKSLCTANALYKPPFSLLPPPRRAARDALLSRCEIPGARGQAAGRPAWLSPDRQPRPRLRCRRSRLPQAEPGAGGATTSAARQIRPTASRPTPARAAAAPFEELIAGWHPRQRRAAARRAGRHDGRRGRRDLAGRGQEPDRDPH
jgi:hypothetical protein